MSKQTFVANTILTAAQMNTLQTNDYNQTVSTKTASYTLVATDAGTKIVMNSASATTITVNTSLFVAGDNLLISNIGAGVCTVTAGTATVSSAGPLAVPQYGGGTLYFTSAGVSIYSPSAVTVAAPAASGLTLITAQSLTSGSSVNILNCFSATYRNYLIIGDSIVGPTDGYGFQGNFGVSGTPTSANYVSSNFGGATGAAVNFISISTFRANQGFIINCYAPNAAATTMYTHMSSNDGGTGKQLTGYQTGSSAFTDFQVSMQGGSTDFTGGTVRIYGYANS